MNWSWYLLIPVSPIIAILCLLVFIYEWLFFNKEERVENKYIASNALKRVLDYLDRRNFWFLSCLDLYFLILDSLHFVGRIWTLLRKSVWELIFLQLVPKSYFWWNSRVYEDLCQDAEQIRLLELSRGPPSAKIEARFVNFVLNEEGGSTPYEALSYSWGGHLMLRRLITLNERSFLVTDTVFNALKELRLPNRDRRLWVDAICINQGNYEEKGRQVTLMGSIYRKAHSVIVWLGKDHLGQESAIDFVRKVGAANPSHIGSLCADVNAWQPPLKTLVSSRWWSRVWVVQEVVLGRDVKVRKGQHEVEWETLAQCFKRLSEIYQQHLDPKVIGFVDTIAELKHSQEDPANGLLDLAIRFRNRVAANPRDKLLGFAGLLRSMPANIPENPYRRMASDVFAYFAGSHILESGSLAIMALAEDCGCNNRTWAVDWELWTSQEWTENDPFSDRYTYERLPLHMFWSGGLLPSISVMTGRQYSATGNRPAICREGKPCWKDLYLTGWQVDTIKESEDSFWDEGSAATIIRSWESLAGGPWTNAADSRRVKFIRTLVADAWQGDLPPDDWPEQYQRWLFNEKFHKRTIKTMLSYSEPDIEAQHVNTANAGASFTFEQAITICCWRRTFFVTESGRFGLGPMGLLWHSSVCLFPGASVPFILKREVGGPGFDFQGQAYVDGLMNYEGDLTEDMRTGKVTTQEFLIR